MPVAARYRPDPRHPELGGMFYDPVSAAEFPKHILRFRNNRWAARVGLEALSDAEWIAHFGRFEPLPENLAEPLALRYHGHQFRVYNPDLGDGRGFLFAQMRDAADGRLLDLGTKGSGQTPWSRSGDGRLTLKGGVREILASEALEARGAPTSKTFSLIETGEKLYRGDEPSPTRSAVMVRLSHSHIRIGTFQRLRACEEVEAIRRLVDYCLAVYHPRAADRATIADPNDAPALLFEAVVQAVAELGAAWFAAGFVHGVLNTDNIAITGESFDYGPWRFLERYDPDFTAAYFDHGGLYAYGRQAEALHWTLARFADCLLSMTPLETLEPIYQSFSDRFDKALIDRTFYRLGLRVEDADRARAAARALWAALHETAPPFERVFFDLAGGARPERLAHSPLSEMYANSPWVETIEAVRAETPAAHLQAPAADAFWAQSAPEDMLIDEVERLWAAIDRDDDWAPLQAKTARLRAVGGATPPPDGPAEG